MTIKDAIEENKEWFEEIFDTIIPWNEQFVAVDKLVWVRCRGLPLKLWNYDCFKHRAALLGTLVEIDEATLALEEMEYARFRIRVSVGCEAKTTSYMNINDVLYQVSVEEEYTVQIINFVNAIGAKNPMVSELRDFEEVRKVDEEISKVDASLALPPTAQGCQNLGPSAPESCCKPIMARTVGSVSTPRSIIGLTWKSFVGLQKRPSVWCIVKRRKGGLDARREVRLWNGLPGSPVNSECFLNLHKSEKNELPGAAIDAAHQVVSGNGKINARSNILIEVTHGSATPTFSALMPTNSKETRHLNTNTNFQSGRCLCRIRDTYAPFVKSTNNGDHLAADAMVNQTKQDSEPVTSNSSSVAD
ncbi:hypothetical protein PHAVU_011G108300 [Phaseolus vulgaris]|uniref:Uncharacterized protein n=1 Tax=Phaseolus vulgaris TaxID=3885 RepID=V7AH52_PHAVU|nr:hypothetical protein PHAVU_011G108300g [Phaseolus vulgaris]ESW04590.1 hypothetical protein PHAVU_011G108300g [Phaseolus vulgaris]